jgi:Putative zinc-finger
MTCSEVQRILPEFLDGAPDGAFQTAFAIHLKSCPACSDLVSDLKLIASEVRELAEAEEPAPRVWLRIAAQLREEGLIREAEPVSAGRPILVPASPRWRWTSTAWWLAPVAAALLVAGSYVIAHKPASQVAMQAPTTSITTPAVTAPVTETPAGATPSVPVSVPATQQLARKSATPTGEAASLAELAAKPAVESEPSDDDQQFLSLVSTQTPSMRATYKNQLQAVNSDIREVQDYLDRNPGDVDARQHLMDAYQQKALLYQMALDRIQ